MENPRAADGLAEHAWHAHPPHPRVYLAFSAVVAAVVANVGRRRQPQALVAVAIPLAATSSGVDHVGHAGTRAFRVQSPCCRMGQHGLGWLIVPRVGVRVWVGQTVTAGSTRFTGSRTPIGVENIATPHVLGNH